MLSSGTTEKQQKGCVFEAFRAIGSVTDDCAFSVHARGKEAFVTTAVGRTWHLYNMAKLALKLVGPQHPGKITHIVNKGDLTIAAVGAKLCVSKRAHLIQTCETDARERSLENSLQYGNILQMLLIGDVLLTLHQGGSLVRWSVGGGVKTSDDNNDAGAGAGAKGKEKKGPLVCQDTISFDGGFKPTCMCHPPAYLNKVVVGSRDGRAQLLNVMTKKCIYTFAGLTEDSDSDSDSDSDDVFFGDAEDGNASAAGIGIRCIVASPALDVVAFALTSNKIVLHNLKFDEKVTDFVILNTNSSSSSKVAVRDRITSIAFSTGTALPLMAVGTFSGTILIFDLEKRHLQCIMGEGGSDIMSHSQKVLSLHFIPGKPVLLSSGEDNSIKQWLFNDTLDTLPTLLRFRQGHSMPPTLVRHYDKSGGNAHQQSSDNQAGTKLLSCSSLDKTFRVFSAHKDEQSFEMSQKNVARRAKRIKLTDSSQLKLSAVKDIAFCSLRENDWCNVVTAHENETCAYTWRLGKHALGEFTLQPPLAELIHMQRSLDSSGQAMRIDTHTDAQNLMKKHLLSPVTSVGISNCGHYALVGCKNGRMDRYNLQSGFHRGSFYRYSEQKQSNGSSSFLKIHLAHDSALTGIECDVFNKEIFTAGEDQTLRVWAFSLMQLRKKRRNVSKDDLLLYEETFDKPIEKLANHKHSSLLAISFGSSSSEEDSDSIPEVCLYDTWARKVVRRFNKMLTTADGKKKSASSSSSKKLVHCEGTKINDLCFSQDGKWLLTCGSDHKIAIWDVPGSQVLQVLQVPEGSACVSLSLSPGKTMLATTHENCKGIYLWSNKLVYSPGTNLALTHSTKPIKVDLPLLNPTFNEDEEEEEEEKELLLESEDLLDVHMDVNEDGGVAVTTVRPLGGEGEDPLVTLSLLPRSHWHGLMYQEQIKERNKPKEVVKKPEHAPFFLPTTTTTAAASNSSLDSSATEAAVPGNQPVFDLEAKIPGWGDEDDDDDDESSKKATKINRDFQMEEGSLFLKAVHRGEERGGNYASAVQQLKSMSPAQIHAEIQSFESLGETLEKEDVQRLKSVIQFIETQVTKQTDFELIQAFLQVFLRMHMKSLMGHPVLAQKAVHLRAAVEESWSQVDDKLQRVTCMLGHFLRLQT